MDINLFPWRQRLQYQRRRKFTYLLAISGAVTILVIPSSWLYTNHLVRLAKVEVQRLTKEKKHFALSSQNYLAIRKQYHHLRNTIHSIETIKQNQKRLLINLEKISSALPNELYLHSILLIDNQWTLQGHAKLTLAVTQFAKNLSINPAFSRVQIKHIQNEPNNHQLIFMLDARTQ